MPYNKVQGVNAGFITYVDRANGEDPAHRCSNINIGLMEADHCTYRISFGHSGDNVFVGMLKTDSVGRSYSCHGVKNHKVNIQAKNSKLSNVSLWAWQGGGCEDIDVTCVDTESTDAANYRSELLWNDQTPAVFRNIRLHMNNVFGAVGKTGTAVLRIGKRLNDGSSDDTVDRGHVLENLTVSGSSEGTPLPGGAALIGTSPGCAWVCLEPAMSGETSSSKTSLSKIVEPPAVLPLAL